MTTESALTAIKCSLEASKQSALDLAGAVQLEIDNIDDVIENLDTPPPSGETWETPSDFELDVAAVALTAPSYWTSVKTYHDRMAANIPAGWIGAYGDSHTQGLCVQAIHECCINMGIGGDTMRGVLNRTIGYAPLDRCAAVLLMIGTNDFVYEGANWIYNVPLMIDKLLDHLEGGPVIWTLIPPIKQANQSGQLTQANINTVNGMIVSKAAAYANVHILDLSADLKDANGYLKAALTDDGMHLNAAGQVFQINGNKTKIAALGI